jgi:hypothetical protein
MCSRITTQRGITGIGVPVSPKNNHNLISQKNQNDPNYQTAMLVIQIPAFSDILLVSRTNCDHKDHKKFVAVQKSQ